MQQMKAPMRKSNLEPNETSRKKKPLKSLCPKSQSHNQVTVGTLFIRQLLSVIHLLIVFLLSAQKELQTGANPPLLHPNQMVKMLETPVHQL